MTQTSKRHGISGKMGTMKGEADGVWLRKESVGSNEVRVVDTPAVGEDGMYGQGGGEGKEERSID